MNVYTTEEEQIEAIKLFFQRHGKYILLTLIVCLAAFSAWRFWQKKQAVEHQQAASYYQQMIVSASKKDDDGLLAQANYLQEHFSGTSYAKLAALHVAKYYVEQAQYDKASEMLNKLVAKTDDPALRDLAHLRLANLLLGKQESKKALEQLSMIQSKAFMASKQALMGDVLVAEGDSKAAREAYHKAWESLPEHAPMRNILMAKIDNYTQA